MTDMPTLANDPAKTAQIQSWLDRHPLVTLKGLTPADGAECARQYHAAIAREHGVALAMNRKFDREHPAR